MTQNKNKEDKQTHNKNKDKINHNSIKYNKTATAPSTSPNVALNNSKIDSDLKARFKSLFAVLEEQRLITQADLNLNSERLWQDIYNHYTQPHRHYHTLTHLQQMFKQLDKLIANLNDNIPLNDIQVNDIPFNDILLNHFPIDDHPPHNELQADIQQDSKLHCLIAISLAIWYHDIIYEPTLADNERQSANHFKRIFNTHLPQSLMSWVEDLIMMTAKHNLATSLKSSQREEAQYFLDIDMTILGAEWEIYRDYAKKIQLEFQHLPIEEYKRGRARVLDGFLKRDRIYFSDWFFNSFEEKARKNIQKELDQLLV